MRSSLVASAALIACVAASGCGAVTRPATRIGAGSARLNARGHTDGTPAHYFFEYGRHRAELGTPAALRTPVRGPIPPGVPGGTASRRFSEGVSGLEPATRYFFEVCGGDGLTGGDVCADVRTFRTRPGRRFTAPGSYAWTVPAHVRRVAFDLAGAGGGAAFYSTGTNPPGGVTTGVGGLGAHVHAVLSVHPGETLTLLVGGAGADGSLAGMSPGGFNGGSPVGAPGPVGTGGGGGGASDVRTGPAGAGGLSSRILVAGGGGGAGTWRGADTRGGDGGVIGAAGEDGFGQAGGIGMPFDPGGGGGGTASAGGHGGHGFGDGMAGMLGLGGQGADAESSPPIALGSSGGGGAGGFFGGGGGGGGLQGDRAPAAMGSPGAGGGGSSLAASNTRCAAVVQPGVQKGDGSIVITYDPRGC